MKKTKEFKRKRIRQRPQMCCSTQEKYAEICENIRKTIGRTVALEKELGEDPKQAYCFLFGKPKKLTPSEILEFKEAGMKIEYLSEKELKERINLEPRNV